VESEISLSGYKNKLIAGIVVTGGGANLKNLVQLIEYKTGMDVRIGLPIEHLAPVKLELVKHPMYATSVGLIMKGFEDYESRQEQQLGGGILITDDITMKDTLKEKKASGTGLFGNILGRTKNWFNEGVDDDFKKE